MKILKNRTKPGTILIETVLNSDPLYLYLLLFDLLTPQYLW